MDLYVEPLQRIIDEFAKLPGVGYKTAVRLAFHMVNLDKVSVEDFAKTIVLSRRVLKECKDCYNVTDKELCNICSNSQRKDDIICVVETAKDLVAMERTRGFKGKYHVLGGVISPSQDIGPEDIRIKELIKRLEAGGVEEVIIATSSTIEGEATSSYIYREIRGLDISVTRLAHGIPVGGELELADEVTLSKALEGRRKL